MDRYVHATGTSPLLTVLQPFWVRLPGTQSPKAASGPLMVPDSFPPVPTHLNTRAVAVAPPCVNVPRMRMSPIVCWPLHVPVVPGAVGIGATGDLKNQKPKSAEPFCAKRSAPKYRIWSPLWMYLAA